MSLEIIFPTLIVMIALAALLFTTWRIISIGQTLNGVDANLKALTDKFTDLDRKFLHARVAQEASMADTLRMMQAEVKSLEMQLRDHGLTNRENPETVEAAIRLVHKGLPADQIVNRTGLPLEVVESIILFHGNR